MGINWNNHKEIAYTYMPHVIHGVKHKWKDRITEVFYGDVPKDDDNARKFVYNLPMNVYFEVVENFKSSNRIIAYNFHHRRDYSLNKVSLIAHVDSHHLDFEGIIKCISEEGEVLWTCTRSHYSMLFQKGDSKVIYIEPEGHAIKPDNGIRNWAHQEVLPKNKFVFFDMKANWKQLELHVWPVFRRYHIDQWRGWNDRRIEHKFGRIRTIGLLEKNPDLFYRYAKSCQIVKGV